MMKLIISKSRYPNLRANLSEVVLRAISLVRFGRQHILTPTEHALRALRWNVALRYAHRRQDEAAVHDGSHVCADAQSSSPMAIESCVHRIPG